MRRENLLFSLFVLFAVPLQANAGLERFTAGPIFKDYGLNTVIDHGLKNAEKQQFKIVFDVSESMDNSKVNKRFDSLARFINMHVRAGVPKENISLALVVHGKASNDLLQNAVFKSKFDKQNPNEDLLKQLMAAGVNIYLCGQSASYMDIKAGELIPGIEMSLSAMTSNALLQQQGYTLNPF